MQAQESGEQEVNRLAQMAALEQSVESRGRTVEQLREQLRYWEKQSTTSLGVAAPSEELQEQVTTTCFATRQFRGSVHRWYIWRMRGASNGV